MQISTLNQTYIFFLFIAVGTIIGLLFDIFRIIRKTIKMHDISIYIQDILFCFVSGTIMLYTICIFNKGEIRAYVFIAIFLGIIFYFLTFSKYFVIIGNIIGKLIKETIIFISNLVLNILKKLIFKPITFISINLSQIAKFFSSELFHIIPKKCKKKKDFNNKCSNI